MERQQRTLQELIQSFIKNDKKELPQFGGNFTIMTEYGEQQLWITKVLYNSPATIVFFNDDSKAVSICNSQDTYDAEKGLILCVLKRLLTGDSVFKLLKDWIPQTEKTQVTLSDVRKSYKKANAK